MNRFLLSLIFCFQSTLVFAVNINGSWRGEGRLEFGSELFSNVYNCSQVEFKFFRSSEQLSIIKKYGPCFNERGDHLKIPPQTEYFDLYNNSIYLEGEKIGFIKDHVGLVNIAKENASRSFSWKITDGEMKYTDKNKDFSTNRIVNKSALLIKTK